MPSFARSLALLVIGSLLPLAATALLAACGSGDQDGGGDPGTLGGSLTIYSGRSEALVKPVIDEFARASGVEVKVKYGDTAALAALLLEEGDRSPADVFFAQDAGALGAVAAAGLFDELPAAALARVGGEFRARDGLWVGISGRARVVVYNPDLVAAGDLPASVADLAAARFKGQVGWAPTNGSFQAFVTAMRKLDGDAATRAWLEAMKANGVKEYPDNKSIVSAVASGEIAAGLVNHYYLYGFLRDQGEGFRARNHHTTKPGDAGSLVNIAGVGILASTSNRAAARAFIDHLLGDSAQQYFAAQTFEYPLVPGVATDGRLKPLKEISQPDIDLSALEDLQGTVALLREARVLP